MAKSPLMVFLEGADTATFDSGMWSLMFSEARRAGLAGRLGLHLRSNNGFAVGIPERLRLQVSAALVEAAAFRRDVLRELDYVQQAMAGVGPVILLKGASYVFMNLPAAQGRVFSDIDILVSRESLGAAEASLMLGGWHVGQLDPYDERYYREWSHEIPPMTHRRRGTTIDLHHALVMPTCRMRIDSERMVGDAIPIDGNSFWWRLRDEDMLLHAAAHLLFNSEFERGLRDLWDIDLLYRDFATRLPGFADRLAERADQVGLGDTIQQALFLARAFFGTPVQENLLPRRFRLVTRLLARSTASRHRQTRPNGQELADILLAAREMYLRLPNRLLATHLAHKGLDFISGQYGKRTV